EKSATAFDRSVRAWLGREGGMPDEQSFALHFWENITSLGSGPLVGLLVVLVLGYLILARHPKTAVVVALCVSLAAVSGFVLKGVFARPHPMDIVTVMNIDSYSFPSGHSVMSGTTYPVLAALLARVVEGRR